MFFLSLLCAQNQPWHRRDEKRWEKMCSYVTLWLHVEGKAFSGSYCHTPHKTHTAQAWNTMFLVAAHQTCVRPCVWLPAMRRKWKEKNPNSLYLFFYSNRKNSRGLFQRIEERKRGTPERQKPEQPSPQLLAASAFLPQVLGQLPISCCRALCLLPDPHSIIRKSVPRAHFKVWPRTFGAETSPWGVSQ